MKTSKFEREGLTKRYPRVKDAWLEDQASGKKKAYQRPEPQRSQPELDQTEYLNMEDYLENRREDKGKKIAQAQKSKNDQTEELPPVYEDELEDYEDLEGYEDEDYFYDDEDDEKDSKGCFGISCGFAFFLLLVALASVLLGAYLAFR